MPTTCLSLVLQLLLFFQAAPHHGRPAGAARMPVDHQTLAAFEKDLKGNLYKIWNRMSSGSYFPPPVRLVEIPKASGGTRPLGIPRGESLTSGSVRALG